MKYLLSFLLGAVCAIWLMPPTPTVELDNLDKARIIYEVLDTLEDRGYNISEAKDLVVSKDVSPWWRVW
jgi:hypothetical protein